MKLIPYIHFAGNAEEALNFYAAILEGEILDIQTLWRCSNAYR